MKKNNTTIKQDLPRLMIFIMHTVRKCFFCVFMDGEEAEAIKKQKRTWPVSSHLDRTSLVNKGFILWSKDYTKEFRFWGNKAGNPERVADQTQDSLNLARSRSQPYNKFS